MYLPLFDGGGLGRAWLMTAMLMPQVEKEHLPLYDEVDLGTHA